MDISVLKTSMQNKQILSDLWFYNIFSRYIYYCVIAI